MRQRAADGARTLGLPPAPRNHLGRVPICELGDDLAEDAELRHSVGHLAEGPPQMALDALVAVLGHAWDGLIPLWQPGLHPAEPTVEAGRVFAPRVVEVSVGALAALVATAACIQLPEVRVQLRNMHRHLLRPP